LEASLKGRRVLVAEDEGMLAWQVVDVLEGAGAEVVGPCSTVEDVRRLAISERLDGAVLDVNLRGALVFDVAAELQARGVPIVLSSGYTTATIFPPEFHGAPRLRKPYEPQLLLELCQRVFAAPANRRPT
jgi:CheY-like chemotaxis protein